MSEQTLKNEKGEEVKITFPNAPIVVDFNLGQEVWFYLDNSLEVQHGRVIGFFLMPEGEDRLYMYQMESMKEMKDKKMEMRLGTTGKENIGADKEEVKKRFEKIRNKRIEAFIREGEINLGGARAEKETSVEREKEILKEIERLKSLKRQKKIKH